MTDKPEVLKTEPIYFHDCPALGPHTRTVKAYLSKGPKGDIYCWQYRCPFCNHTEGEKHYV